MFSNAKLICLNKKIELVIQLIESYNLVGSIYFYRGLIRKELEFRNLSM